MAVNKRHKWAKGDRSFTVQCVRCGAMRNFDVGRLSRAYDPKTHLAKRWCNGSISTVKGRRNDN